MYIDTLALTRRDVSQRSSSVVTMGTGVDDLQSKCIILYKVENKHLQRFAGVMNTIQGATMRHRVGYFFLLGRSSSTVNDK